jgi:hypothetical protein
MLVAEEYASVAPITVSGGGPLLRIYTLHGADSIEHDLDEETPLSFDPTTGDSWSLSLPALGDDVHTANEALTSAPHVTARDAAAIEASVSASTSQATARPFVPDIEELERP